MQTESLELELLMRFSKFSMLSEPNNHSIPVVDPFQDPDDSNLSFIVTTYLRDPDSPDWDNLDDVMEYLEQVLQGILFYHIHGVSRF